MKLNVKRALALLQRDLKKNWSKLDFEYEIKEDKISVASTLTLNNVEGSIRAIISVYSGGGTICRAVLDKIDATEDTLNAINRFNDDNVFFKAFIREDGYLELSSFFVAYEIGMLKFYASEFLSRLADLADDEIIQGLAKLTYTDD